MRFDLTSKNIKWQMSYAHAADAVKYSIKTISDIKSSGLEMHGACVPGNFETDLMENGIIGDPYYGKNVLETHKYEDCHIWYYARFDVDSPDERDIFLTFEGLDTYADVYLNGVLTGSTDNMLISHKIKIDSLSRENQIVVHIKPTCVEAAKYDYPMSVYAQKYNYESLFVRKASHMFGWDIAPRIVSAGIWRPVYLSFVPKERINDIYVQTVRISGEDGPAAMSAFFDIKTEPGLFDGYELMFEGSCKDSSFGFTKKIYFSKGQINFGVNNTKLWYPAGRGKKNLYDITVKLLKYGNVLDTYTLKTGVRTVALDRTGITDENGSGRFCIIVNGEKVFIKGSNWVPADMLHSRDKERIPAIIDMVCDIGCNTLRCWGGNVYEDDLFYELCDQKGIMIWQDFAMACAVYPQSEDFCRRLEIEAKSVVKRLRSHPCIILWAGDNECDQAQSWGGFRRDPNQNVLTRKVLPDILKEHDHLRPYIPSSPYIDEEGFKSGDKYLSENHLWGPRDYYKSNYYKNSLCHFASEMGYHGCPSPDSIKKFISPENIWPWQENTEWLIHASAPVVDPEGPYNYRIELMAKQIKELFGFIPDDLDDFAFASQISQAEAKKFFVELFRSSKWRRTGIIWWNLMDGWPQFSDAVVDYYFEKKLAYEYIKRSQQPVCIMIKEPDNWRHEIVVCNDTREGTYVEYEICDAETGGVIKSGKVYANSDSVTYIGEMPFSQSDKKFYIINWKSAAGDGINHYLSGHPAFDLLKYKEWMKKAKLN